MKSPRPMLALLVFSLLAAPLNPATATPKKAKETAASDSKDAKPTSPQSEKADEVKEKPKEETKNETKDDKKGKSEKTEPEKKPRPKREEKPTEKPAASPEKEPDAPKAKDEPSAGNAPKPTEKPADKPTDSSEPDSAKLDPPDKKPAPRRDDLPPAPPKAKPEFLRPAEQPKPPVPDGSTKPEPPLPPKANPKPQHPAAAIDLTEVDSDYWYQGEFISAGFFGSQSSGFTGLQVIALGDGKFDAVRYTGGLPGAGWNRVDKQTFSGELNGAGISLVGDAGSMTVYTDWVDVFDANGQVRETLRRVRRISPTMGLRPTPAAIVIFDGTTPSQLEGAKLTDDGLLLAGSTTKFPVSDFRLHLEFRTPYMPQARGQARGNSGVYIQRRYEVQILDSFGLEGVENECGGLYRQRRPELNMCLPPLVWQTYDIGFAPARYDADGNKVANARITILHNGEPIHRNVEIPSKTGAGRPESPELLPINFQDHGNPVTFRNVWIEFKDPRRYVAIR